MRLSPVALVATLVLVTGVALPPRVALAADRHHPGGATSVVGPMAHRPFVHPFGQPSVFHPFFLHQFVPFVVAAPPYVVFAPPPVLFTPPPVIYLQPPQVLTLMPPPPPPTPSVIEYPNGRYTLRGDGSTTPYTWTWIPTPPPAPPETLPLVPPAAPSDMRADPPSTAQRPSAPRAEIHRWTDERGVTTWTDRIGKVPERYRAQAQRVL